MFFPMSWISPLTVARIMVPFFSWVSPLPAMAFLITSKAALAASALINSCGRKTVPFSKPFPTWSSAGMISSLITSRASFSFKRAVTLSTATSFKPLSMAFPRLPALPAPPFPAAPEPPAPFPPFPMVWPRPAVWPL